MSTCRVAIADDAPDVRMLLRTILEEEGFTVVGEARNGVEAVELAETEQPDVMLLDLSMPVMDGLEALPLIRDASPDTAVIVLSGFVNPDVNQKVTDLGAAACVEKGINLAGLVQTVKDLCPAAGRAGATARQATGTAAVRPGSGGTRAAGRDTGSPSGASTIAPTAMVRTAPVLDADDLVPVLLHELNPAVSVLRRSVDLAVAAIDRGDAAAAAAPLDTARRALSGVTGILDAFADVRAADAGQLQLRPELLPVAAVIREAVDDLQSVVAEHPVSVVVDAEVTAPIDGGRLRQVLANLLSNAAKFSKPNSPIEVGVGASNGDALVWVRDHGKGVPGHAAEAVFRKYARIGDAPGMGLGLYIARAIVRAHGGDLSVEAPEGDGAKFVARLPIH